MQHTSVQKKNGETMNPNYRRNDGDLTVSCECMYVLVCPDDPTYKPKQ